MVLWNDRFVFFSEGFYESLVLFNCFSFGKLEFLVLIDSNKATIEIKGLWSEQASVLFREEKLFKLLTEIYLLLQKVFDECLFCWKNLIDFNSFIVFELSKRCHFYLLLCYHLEKCVYLVYSVVEISVDFDIAVKNDLRFLIEEFFRTCKRLFEETLCLLKNSLWYHSGDVVRLKSDSL